MTTQQRIASLQDELNKMAKQYDAAAEGADLTRLVSKMFETRRMIALLEDSK